ncbi:hypothetical protein [Stakelama marina]|uniref:Lipoprotein n=1 Tax=Stakelama marina TaxID=2826939 RepID=A0A8T4IHS0_9SPHN|nr:hypothetical protein [Stakelama marina]MBR0553582.1 hypothetical protein [Stakelama marina]
MRKSLTILMLTTGLAACSSADHGANASAGGDNDAGSAVVNVVDETTDVIGSGIADAGNAIVGPVKPGPYDDWVGRWVGVEGTYLDITKAEGGGDKYLLKMQYDLDHNGTFDGVATDKGIRFTRPGGTYVLHHTDGNATGMKYLAGKKDCLTVEQGEGYCRD